MTCAGDGSVGARNIFQVFRNWARTRRIVVANKVRPVTLAQLVAAIQDVETNGGVIRAMGSGWSYSDVAVDTDVTHLVDTSALNAVLSNVIPAGLNNASMASRTPDGHSPFVHVEAGIKIHDVNCSLNELGLAMATLGGSNGQSVAGVIGTGTHGADVNIAPIADWVRAIHLVGPGGQEWWIEPEGDEAITDPARMRALVDEGVLCSDIRIEYDSTLFNAVLVSMGRMGIIYSIVIEAEDAYRLEESRQQTTWSRIVPEIRNELVNSSADYTRSRFVEVVVNPYRDGEGNHTVIATRRQKVSTPANTEPVPPDIFQMFCNQGTLTPILAGLAASLPGIIAAVTATALAGISWMLAIPFGGGLMYAAASSEVIATATAGLITLETVLTAALATPGENLSEKLANIINLSVLAGQGLVVPRLVDALIESMRGVGNTPPVRESFRISTGQEACSEPWHDLPECMRRIDGYEFALNCSPGRTNLFDFMDDVFALTAEFAGNNRPPAYAMSLRFTRATRALLGMQQFDRTCSIEFMLLRGVSGHADFVTRLYALARRHGAIPHWGLIHNLSGREVASLYGNRHIQWRQALERLIAVGDGRARTFSTRFSRQRDLEPLPGCVLPTALVNVIRDILAALGRSRRMDAAASEGSGKV